MRPRSRGLVETIRGLIPGEEFRRGAGWCPVKPFLVPWAICGAWRTAHPWVISTTTNPRPAYPDAAPASAAAARPQTVDPAGGQGGFRLGPSRDSCNAAIRTSCFRPCAARGKHAREESSEECSAYRGEVEAYQRAALCLAAREARTIARAGAGVTLAPESVSAVAVSKRDRGLSQMSGGPNQHPCWGLHPLSVQRRSEKWTSHSRRRGTRGCGRSGMVAR
jgi:hypothetical protein